MTNTVGLFSASGAIVVSWLRNTVCAGCLTPNMAAREEVDAGFGRAVLAASVVSVTPNNSAFFWERMVGIGRGRSEGRGRKLGWVAGGDIVVASFIMVSGLSFVIPCAMATSCGAA